MLLYAVEKCEDNTSVCCFCFIFRIILYFMPSSACTVNLVFFKIRIEVRVSPAKASGGKRYTAKNLTKARLLPAKQSHK